jgi:hypothetical protein
MWEQTEVTLLSPPEKHSRYFWVPRHVAQLPSCAYQQTFTTLAPAYVVGPAHMDAPVLQLNFVHICFVQ